jgi:ribose-phosphate pyrophosphokinase
MNTTILALPGAENLAQTLASLLQCPASMLEVHRFPDGEGLVRLRTGVEGQRVLVAAHLDHPDDKTLAVLFAADAARDLGAAQIGLVAPYLPYMRQDERFRPGEAITSQTYARILCATFDFLVTVDPHLHRIASLDALYSIPNKVVAAAPAIAEWLAREVPRPLLVGPDAESEQWVADVAGRMGVPHVVMTKERRGDRDVQVCMPEGARCDDRVPVLLDDIASSGHTLATAAQVVRAAGWGAPMCIAVHALLDANGMDLLHRAGIPRIVSCDTIPHATNAIALGPWLAEGVRGFLEG